MRRRLVLRTDTRDVEHFGGNRREVACGGAERESSVEKEAGRGGSGRGLE